jgi:hypothetical protein
LWDLRRDGYVFEKRRTADPRIEEWRLVGRPEETATREPAAPPPTPASVSLEPHQRRLL